MLSLHTNAAVLNAQNNTSITQRMLTTTQTRLATGFRVNSAQDDAAGLQIATRIEAANRGMTVAQRNTQNGVSLLQNAEGALKTVSDVLLRMKDLATEAANTAVVSQDDVDAMQFEFDELGKELHNILNSTRFSGETLFGDGAGTVDGSAGKFSAALSFHIGASSGETLNFDATTNLTDLATKLTAVVATYDDPAAASGAELGTATGAIDNINAALGEVGKFRAFLGATANRLDYVFNNLQNQVTQGEQARGRIMDTNYAVESANGIRQQLLLQASTMQLKQSSQLSQLTLSLLQ